MLWLWEILYLSNWVVSLTTYQNWFICRFYLVNFEKLYIGLIYRNIKYSIILNKYIACGCEDLNTHEYLLIIVFQSAVAECQTLVICNEIVKVWIIDVHFDTNLWTV